MPSSRTWSIVDNSDPPSHILHPLIPQSLCPGTLVWMDGLRVLIRGEALSAVARIVAQVSLHFLLYTQITTNTGMESQEDTKQLNIFAQERTESNLLWPFSPCPYS